MSRLGHQDSHVYPTPAVADNGAYLDNLVKFSVSVSTSSQLANRKFGQQKNQAAVGFSLRSEILRRVTHLPLDWKLDDTDILVPGCNFNFVNRDSDLEIGESLEQGF